MFSITVTIILITALITFAAFNNEKVNEDMLFWPSEINSRKQYYRFFSYGFIHLNLVHIMFNMFTLYSFGLRLEKYTFSQFEIFGTHAKIFYLLLYLTAIVVSVLPDYFKNKHNPSYRALGASGAVSAVIFCLYLTRAKNSLLASSSSRVSLFQVISLVFYTSLILRTWLKPAVLILAILPIFPVLYTDCFSRSLQQSCSQIIMLFKLFYGLSLITRYKTNL